MRFLGILILLLQYKAEEKNWFGKEKFQYAKQLMESMKCKSYLKMKELFLNREEQRSVPNQS